MPRLVGRRTSAVPYVVSLFILGAIASGILHHAGIIDIPSLIKGIEQELKQGNSLHEQVTGRLIKQQTESQEQESA